MIVKIAPEVYSSVNITNFSYTNLVFMGSESWFPTFTDNILLCISHSKWEMCPQFLVDKQVIKTTEYPYLHSHTVRYQQSQKENPRYTGLPV